VAAQTWLPREVIVVDDGSHDRGATRQAVEEAKACFEHQSVRLIRLENNVGPGVARNVGWDAATEQYVAFLDADDSWHPAKIAIQLRYMLEAPDVDFTAHLWKVRLEEEKEDPALRHLEVVPLRAWKLLLRNVVATPTVIVKRCLPFRFPPRRFAEDYELWLELLLSGCKGVLIKQVLAYLHKAPYGKGGLSGDLWAMERGELETYWRLFRRGRLGMHHLFVCVPWSFAKYVRRAAFSIAGRAKY